MIPAPSNRYLRIMFLCISVSSRQAIIPGHGYQLCRGGIQYIRCTEMPKDPAYEGVLFGVRSSRSVVSTARFDAGDRWVSGGPLLTGKHTILIQTNPSGNTPDQPRKPSNSLHIVSNHTIFAHSNYHIRTEYEPLKGMTWNIR